MRSPDREDHSRREGWEIKALRVFEELRLDDSELEAAGDHEAAPAEQKSGHGA